MRLQTALTDLDARYRGQGDRILKPKAEDLASSGHHLLLTRFGPLDVLGTIGRDHDFMALLPHTDELEVKTMRLRVLSLEKLIAIKEEIGHVKDMQALPLLKKTLEEKTKK